MKARMRSKGFLDNSVASGDDENMGSGVAG